MLRPFALAAALVMILAASPALHAHDISLPGSEWGFAGESGPRARFISFSADGHVSGHGGCNRFMGQYKQEGEALALGPLAATRMACPEADMAREQELFKLLENTRGFRASHLELELLDENGRSLAKLVRRDAD